MLSARAAKMFERSAVFLLLLVIAFAAAEINSPEKKHGGKSKILSRQRRYVSFPEGSSFSCAGCMTVGMIGDIAPITNPGYFTFGLNWGIAYGLPNETEETIAYYKMKRVRKPTAQRRNRRDLYRKLEVVINSMGYNGRDCVLKTLCETTQRIAPRGNNVIEEMFRTLFTLPMTKLVSSDSMEHAVYDSAHKLGHLMEDCDRLYHRCPLSLVDLVKGYYNTPGSRLDAAGNLWSLYRNSFS